MERKDHRAAGGGERGASPRKRFRLEKLEERIAPAAHYNPQSKLVGGGGGGGSGGSASSGLSGSISTIY